MSAVLRSQAVESRAAVFEGPNSIAVRHVDVPAPGSCEIRVRLEGCGVCGSNLPVWEGRPWFQYPFTPGSPGHEGWGIVDALGAGVTNFAIGDRVAVLSHRAYAEYDIAPASAVVKLPSQLTGRSFPGEALGCVMNIFRRSEIEPGQTVAIVGVGFIGTVLTALAVQAGARVIAITRRPFALELAEQYGAQVRIRLDDPARALGEAQRIVGDAGCERVIEAIGTQQGLDLASALAGVRARLVIAGYHQDGSRQIDMQSWNWRGLDVINAHERDPAQYLRGMQEAVDLVASGRFDPSPLYTHQFALDEISGAFDALATRPHGFLKALVMCS